MPVKANTLTKLVKVLTTGIATSNKKDELLEVIEAAEVIGIYLYRYELDETIVSSNIVETIENNIDSETESFENYVLEETNVERELIDDSETNPPTKKRGRPRGSAVVKRPTFKCDKCETIFCKKRDMKKHMCRGKLVKVV